MTPASPTPWRDLYPVSSFYALLIRALLALSAILGVAYLAPMFFIENRQEWIHDPLGISLGFAFLASFAGIALTLCLQHRSEKKSFSLWIVNTNPSQVELARIGASHEAWESERKVAQSELNKRDPLWRTRVLQQSPVPPLPNVSLLMPLPSTPAREKWMECAHGVFLLAMGGATLWAFFNYQIDWRWGFFFMALILLFAPVMIRLMESRATQRERQWEKAVLQTYSPDEIAVMAANMRHTSKGFLLYRLMNREFPGWSFKNDALLWAKVCHGEDG